MTKKSSPVTEVVPPYNVLKLFHPPVQSWFEQTFSSPTCPQQLGWPAIYSGTSTLILSPTGSGKTLTAFMAAIDSVMFDPTPPVKERCRILYISPLKALAVDVQKNLQEPIWGILEQSREMGTEVNRPEIAIRTGDTPGKERAKFQRHPADILITTPESLYLMLTSAVRETLKSVRCVIIDEVHAMVGTKRGSHLTLSLERLEAIVERPLQRIGLSATQRPLDEVARFMGGYSEGAPRPVNIVDAGRTRQLDLSVSLPAEALQELQASSQAPLSYGYSGTASAGSAAGSGIWAAMPPVILEMVRRHTSTLIFVNSRRLAERLASTLNELAGSEIVQAHHGSIAREQRLLIEDALKSGKLPAMVATSSLELGIDMGAIDLVIQIGAPPTIAAGMQRIGRAGHQIGMPSTGVILPKFRGDLLACAALTERMLQGMVEEMHYPRNPLDVLAQQIVAIVSIQDVSVDELDKIIRGAAPYAELPSSSLFEVLDMLSGKYPSTDFAELRPRITWDRWSNVLTSRQGAKGLAITNGGTIADRGLYPVYLAGSDATSKRGKGRVGELDEEMVHESKVGDVVLLGASSWRIEEITHDRVNVSPAPGVAGKTPFWHGDAPGRPLEFGRAIGSLCRTLKSLEPTDALDLLISKHALEPGAASSLLGYLSDQQEITGAIPDDQTILVEYTRDELGDWRICILSPFGAQVHGPWAMAIGAIIYARRDIEVDVLWADDGIIIRYPNSDDPPPAAWFTPSPEEVEELVVRQLGVGGGGARKASLIGGNSLFASCFREAAGRSLLLPRRYPGHRNPLWQTRKRAADLLQVASQFPTFPIILETYREILKDIFDMDALRTLLTEIESGDVSILPLTLQRPSPFGNALVFSYVGNFMYEYDAPLAERRAMAMQIDMGQLRELMGDADLRSLLDDAVLEDIENQLQRRDPERLIAHADGLHDLLLMLGDQTEEEIIARFETGERAAAVIGELVIQRRIAVTTIASSVRYVAIEDAARVRDTLCVSVSDALSQDAEHLSESSPDPLGELLARYARTHGPFTTEEAAERFGLGVSIVNTSLIRMSRAGRITEGEFRPETIGKEWCDSDVLTMWRRRTLAKSRSEIQPVDVGAYCRLLLSWQGVDPSTRKHSLITVIEQLQGASLPASILESQILPSRLPDYSSSDLDELMSSGMVVWKGVETLGQKDGRVRLALAEDAPILFTQHSDTQSSDDEVGAAEKQWTEHPTHMRILDYLQSHGASFFAHIQTAVRGFKNETLDALWDLVWSGYVTNDTLQPMRAMIKPAASDARASGKRAALAARTRGMARGHVTATPREAAGRWSLTSSLYAHEPITATERLAAIANQLLARHGVLTRETVQAESTTVVGGFSTLYPMLRQMEERGAIRRGYFVEGMGPSQFALPGAIDRLRILREPEAEISTLILSAVDTANPFGGALPWPEKKSYGGRKPMRLVGSWVIITDGYLAGWLAPGDTQLVTFLEAVPHLSPEIVAAQIANVLAKEVTVHRRRAVFLTEIDGSSVPDELMGTALETAGFHRSDSGYQRKL